MIIIPVPDYGDVLYHNMTTIQSKYFDANKENIINNVFLKEDYKNKFSDWINHNNKIIKLVKKFYNIIKNKYIQNKLPENSDDLDGESYNKNNKNIYLYENNKKWWFSIKTMSKLIINNLYYFDTEYLKNYSKKSSNPYTNKKFDYNTYVSIYLQFKQHNSVPDMFLVFKLCNFNLNKFIETQSILINQYICKYVYPTLESETLADLFINLTQSYNINYINYNKLYDYADLIKNDILNILKFINSPKNSHIKVKNYIKTILSFHTYLIKKAKKIRVVNPSSNMSVDSDNNSNSGNDSDNNSNSDNDSDCDNNNLNNDSDCDNNNQDNDSDCDNNNQDSVNYDSDNSDNQDSVNNDSDNSDNQDSVNNDYENDNQDSVNYDSDNTDNQDSVNNDYENDNQDSVNYDSDNTDNQDSVNNDCDADNFDLVNNEDQEIIVDGITYDFSSIDIENNNN